MTYIHFVDAKVVIIFNKTRFSLIFLQSFLIFFAFYSNFVPLQKFLIMRAFISKEGLGFTILKSYGSFRTIRNDKLGIINRAHIKDIESGQASLYFPNGGYVICADDKSYNEIQNSKSYNCWRGILNRVGRGKYKNVKIHKDWLNYWKFREFFDLWHKDGYYIDKDLLSEGEKIYSEHTCCFLPPCLNSAIIECSRKGKKYSRRNGRYCFEADLGRGCSPVVITSKTKQEYEKLYALYRCVKIRTLLSLHETQIMPRAIRRIKELWRKR